MNANPTQLKTQLDAELNALHAFIALLGQEQQALLNNDAEQLLSLAESKSQAATHLSELIRQRHQTWLATPDATMETVLASVAPALAPIWQNLCQLAQQAQEANHINGELIQSGLRRNQQSLAALQSASQHAAGLYGPDGQPNLGGSGRILGSV